MKFKKIASLLTVFSVVLSTTQAFAITSYEFDWGMSNGIDYFNRDMYIEARDEFQWFCDYNWGQMNEGQRQYALDYLDAAKAEVANYVTIYRYNNGIESKYLHRNAAAYYLNNGWSYTYPKTKYETTYTGLESMARRYWNDWLYWPEYATLHSIYVDSTWDDWENGILYADVYIDATCRTLGGYYTSSITLIELYFNKYTGEYGLVDVTEY